MSLNEMSKKDFKKIRHRTEADNPVICDAIVVMPLKKIHDSGYSCMRIIAVDYNDKLTCVVSENSDVIDFRGYEHLRMECLKKSRLFCFWYSCGGKMRCDNTDASTFMVGEYNSEQTA